LANSDAYFPNQYFSTQSGFAQEHILTATKGRTRALTQHPITCMCPTSHTREVERGTTQDKRASSGTGTMALRKAHAKEDCAWKN